MHSILLPVLLLLCTASAWPAPRKRPCNEAVISLASGVFLNIRGQYAEYNGTVNILDIESSPPVDRMAFEIAKGELLSDIQGGMNIRLFNQEIAPPGNAAIPGLTKYANAQVVEQRLAQGLTGIPSKDRSALKTLKSDIMAGIKLNEQNLASAIEGCEFYLRFPPADQSG